MHDNSSHQNNNRHGARDGLVPVNNLGFMISALLAILLAVFVLAVIIGPVNIPVETVGKIILNKIVPGLVERDWSQSTESIVWLLRFPRALLAILVGGGLSVVGVTMQALVRNPLADPYILGVSSGASVGAVAVMIFGLFGTLGMYTVSIAAFTTGVLTFIIVWFLAQRRGQVVPLRIILAGIAVSYVCSAVTSFMVIRSPDAEGVQSVLYWLLGSLGSAKWEYLTIPLVGLLVGTGFLLVQARSLNSILIGDETAITLGVNTNRLRKQLIVVASLVTGIMVAVSGAIGFVGLMMPHAVRLVAGSDHRKVLPLSLLSGSIFMVLVDIVARVVLQPEELPVGIITAIIGAPFFLWLMRRSEYSFGGKL